MGEQLVAEVQPVQRRTCARNIHWTQQVQQTFAQAPLTQFSSQNRSDHALARWQRGRLMDQADARAKTLTLTGRQLPGALAEHLQLTVIRSQGGGQQVEQARLARAG